MTIRRADLERALGRSPKHARTSRAAERAGLLVLRPDGLLEITPLAASILEWHEKGMHTTRQCIEWWWFQDDSDGDGYITLSDCADHLKVRVKSLRRVGAFILSTRQLLLTNVISVDDGDVKVHAA